MPHTEDTEDTQSYNLYSTIQPIYQNDSNIYKKQSIPSACMVHKKLKGHFLINIHDLNIGTIINVAG